jgi:hypothetical protein
VRHRVKVMHVAFVLHTAKAFKRKERKMTVLCYPVLPDYLKSIAFWKVSRLRPFLLSCKVDHLPMKISLEH